MRRFFTILVPVCLFALAAYPSWYGSLYVRREMYRLFELVGIMHAGGDLGGQLLGFNYQRHPEWAHYGAVFVSGVVAFAPAVLGAVYVRRRMSGAAYETRCGGCGRVLRGLSEPRCPHCGGAL